MQNFRRFMNLERSKMRRIFSVPNLSTPENVLSLTWDKPASEWAGLGGGEETKQRWLPLASPLDVCCAFSGLGQAHPGCSLPGCGHWRTKGFALSFLTFHAQSAQCAMESAPHHRCHQHPVKCHSLILRDLHSLLKASLLLCLLGGIEIMPHICSGLFLSGSTWQS